MTLRQFSYQPQISFTLGEKIGFLRVIMVSSAVDYFRGNFLVPTVCCLRPHRQRKTKPPARL